MPLVKSLAINTILGLLLYFIIALPSYAAVTYDLATSTNWNIRIDGAVANSYFTHTGIPAADLDGNGQPELIISAFNGTYNSRAASGAVYIIFDSLLSTFTKGSTIDLSNPANYNIRFDGGGPGTGSASGDGIGNGLAVADLNSDGRKDLLLAAPSADYNSRRNSGSLYIIYNSILQQYSGTGNNIDLTNTANFNIRIDGDQADPGGNLGISDAIVKTEDLDGDNKQDLFIIHQAGRFNSRSSSGGIFVLYNTLLSQYSGTGNLIDLATSSNYNLRFEGAAANERLSSYGIAVVDINNDNQKDLLISSAADYNGRTDSGSLYVVNNGHFGSLTGTGNNIDMATNSNWDLRLDGPATSTFFSFFTLPPLTDLNQDSKLDLIVGSGNSSNNSRSQSGSFYVIFDFPSVFMSYAGTGNTRDMATASNWNIRFDGAVASQQLSIATLMTGDFFSTGLPDILVGARQASYNSRSLSGSLWVIANSIFSSISGTGNTIDLADSSKWSIRYDGVAANDWLSYLESTNLIDLNGDGSNDLLVGSNAADNNSRSESGSLYIIYNFPHNITQSSTSRSSSTVTVSGTVSATNSVTNISGVQYRIDSNSPTGAWSECSASDGSFNSTSETFTCTSSQAPTTVGTHTVYIRAYDAHTSYTAQSFYSSYQYTITNSISTTNSDGSAVVQILKNNGGVYTPTNITGGLPITAIINENTMSFDTYFTGNLLAKYHPKAFNYQGIKYWQITDIYNLWYQDFYNNAKILPILQNKPSIISLSYADIDLVPPGNPKQPFKPKYLKLAYSSDGKQWKIINNSVVDPVNHTVAAITKVGGYYMIVEGNRVKRVKNK